MEQRHRRQLHIWGAVGENTSGKGGFAMFKHEKMLFHPVSVERPNPQYAALLQEQLGGANGELKAAMQYKVSVFLPFVNFLQHLPCRF